MPSVSIYVDGKIDLTDLADTGEVSESTRATADRVRNSRLADVMIVVERGRDALAEALQASLAERALPAGVEHLALELDDTEPCFTVTIEPVASPEAPQTELSADQRVLLESEIAAKVAAWIEQRATRAQTPRWQPNVTATMRSSAEAAESPEQGRLKSVWLRILFWLLAAMILATVYLYLKGMPS